MDFESIAVDSIDASVQLLFIILRKPFLTVDKAQYVPQKESIEFTVANESSHENDIQKIWLLTSYNRPIFSEAIDSKLPVKMLVNDRVTYSLPVEELRAILNKGAGETITDVVVLDKNGRQNVGRLKKSAKEALAK